MKTIILATTLILSLSASAQTYVYPQVFNMGFSAQVQVRNTTQQTISCSGTVYMQTTTGRQETGYYFDRIPAGSFSIRNFYLMNMNERITYTHHSIFCHQAK